MAAIRIRLCFTPDLLKKCLVNSEQCWMLVDRTCCKFVYDLEYLVKKKFFEVNNSFMLSLYLDNCLLPSKEKIEIIRENDVIRFTVDQSMRSEPFFSSVKEDKAMPLLEKTGETFVNGRNSKKRKLASSINSRTSAKKRKHSATYSKVKDEKNTKEEKLKDKHKKATTQTEVKTSFIKNKCQRAAEFLQKVSNKISKGENARNKNEESSKRKHVHTTSSLNVGNKNIVEHKQLPVETSDSSSTDSSDSSSSESSVSDGPLPSKNDNVQKNIKTSSTSSVSVTSATLSNKVSDVLQKNTSNFVREKNKQIPNNKNVNGAVLPCKDKPGLGFQHNRNNHIRFDETDTEISLKTPSVLHDTGSSKPQKHPPTLPPPNVPFIRQTKTLLDSQSPELSPIHPISTTTNYENRGASSKSHSKKDVYTHKSIILESTRVEKQPQQKDFSKYPVLHGPPRVGETVVYKKLGLTRNLESTEEILELSQSYTPEISNYKEGKVLAYCPNENKLKLKLTKESLLRAQGDGHVSFKFELFEINEEDGEPIIPTIEIPDEVDVLWADMIEPRLVTPGN